MTAFRNRMSDVTSKTDSYHRQMLCTSTSKLKGSLKNKTLYSIMFKPNVNTHLTISNWPLSLLNLRVCCRIVEIGDLSYYSNFLMPQEYKQWEKNCPLYDSY